MNAQCTGKMFALWLLFLSCFTARKAAAQDAPPLRQVLINLSARNKSLDKIFQDIEAQTSFRFVYNSAELKAAGPVSVNRRLVAVDEVLREILPPNLEFRQRGYNILVLVRELPPVEAPVSTTLMVNGRITDMNQQPLPGVTIIVQSSRRVAVSNEQGAFAINTNRNDSLELSSVGFAATTVAVSPLPMNIVLSPHQRQALNEIIVIGYGNLPRKKLATSIATVQASQLNERAASINIVEAMAGKVPGASIMLNSGKPGSSPTIKIRGTGSINASNAPLFVLDGIVGLDPLQIDPNIIQSVDILKDAASAAIYGSRGSNGVVLMTTKQGTKNKSVISVHHRMSVASLARQIDLLDAKQSLQLIEQQYAYVPGRVAPHLDPTNNFQRKADLFNADGTPKYNVNWQKEATRTVLSTNTGLTFSGGSDNMTSLVSVSYKKQEGILKNSQFEQINAFANIGWDVKPWLSLKAMIDGGGYQSHNVDLNTLGFNAIREMYEYLPFIPAKYNDGTWSRKGDYPGAENSENPLRLLDEVKSVNGQTYVMSNMTATIHLNRKLDLVTSFSGQLGSTFNNYYAGMDVFGFSDLQNGVATRANFTNGAWNNEDYLVYTDKIGSHKFNMIAGASWYYNTANVTLAGAENFFDDFFSYNNLSAGTISQRPGSDRQQNQMNSFFARGQYEYNNRYFAGASFRVDGSSRFGANNKYGYFPAVWGAWLISNESFFKADRDVISYLKLRASLGVTGNAEIGNYATLSRLNPTQVIFNGQQQPAVVLSNPGNRNLKWERGRQWNVGIDAMLLHDRIEITADVYRKITSDLLYNRQLPATTGYPSIFDNIGSIRNQGLELAIRSRNIVTPAFTWSTSLNFYFNRSKVLHLNGDIIYNWAGRIKEGGPIDQYFGYYRLGIWGTAEAAEAAKFGKKPGDIKWKDDNNNGVKDAGDRMPMGYKMPRYQGDMVNTFTSGPFTLFVDVSAMYGHKLANFTRFIMESPTTNVNSYTGALNAWTPQHQNTMMAQVRLSSDGTENEMDNYYLEDGSFLRIRNIALGYELPAALCKKMRMQKANIMLNAENYFLFTRYKGFDPETTSFDGDLNQGVDVYQYPKAKTISLTLQLQF